MNGIVRNMLARHRQNKFIVKVNEISRDQGWIVYYNYNTFNYYNGIRYTQQDFHERFELIYEEISEDQLDNLLKIIGL